MAKMHFYPALRAKMGVWTYYTTVMSMRDIVDEIQFASEFGVQEDQVDVLGHARQRALAKARVRDNIVEFLQRDKRFFSSLVVATMAGKPAFYPVKVQGGADDSMFSDAAIEQSFGVLYLDDSRETYALDGQHRLAAIKSMLDPEFRKTMGIKGKIEVPDGFEDETLSVIMVVKGTKITDSEFFRGYRQMFSSLNRHAKKTDHDTNIIIDEDDVYAILTRRLISGHEFFKDVGKESNSQKIKMKGSNLNDNNPHFIPLQILYKANKSLLMSESRHTEKLWKNRGNGERPDDEELDALYQELSNYWDAILRVLPALRQDPQVMRPFSAGKPHMFFRPIAQKMMAELVRFMLDRPFPKGGGSVAKMEKCLAPLSKIDWDMLSYPWKGIVAIPSGKKGYIMRSEQRPATMKWAIRVAKAMLGYEEPIEGMRKDWEKLIVLPPKSEDLSVIWDKNIKPLIKVK